ncbi:hypothetical protein AVL62_05430 [Serinicoccus chungangensis]|uniref:DUF1206 domain-containing protein n=1 Tax=Serinicoccus chungangensis TaxID=767452 RepID=A0A0W8I8L8_9MICO|nr:hypothetical protein AVL62_05430 [Serinicoccus chungangensis]
MLAGVSNDIVDEGSRRARQVADHPWLETLARIGFAASGLIHLALGWIAGRVALGGGGEADTSGAIATVREAPAGPVLLWFCVVGFLALALFQVLEGTVGGGGAGDRLKAVGKGVLYAALGVVSVRFATGGGSSGGGESSADLTQRLMEMPGGRWIVGAVALGALGVAVYHVYKGLSQKFLEDLAATGGGQLGTGVRLAGTVGYTAKGVALLVVGGLFGLAAWQADPQEAQGMDGALKTLAEQPSGTALLLAVAVGLTLYGVYSLARARYARMD